MRTVTNRPRPAAHPVRRGILLPLTLFLALLPVPLAGCAQDTGPEPTETSPEENKTEDEKETAPLGTRPSSTGTLLEYQVSCGAIATNVEGYDYFYSSDLSAICRARVDRPEPEVIVTLSGDYDPSGEGPEYVVALLEYDDRIYYLKESLADEQRPDLWCVNVDGSGNTMLRQFDDISFRPACLAIHGGRLLVVAPRGDAQVVMSMSLADQSWADVGTIRGVEDYSPVFLTTELAYFDTSTDPSDPLAYEAICAYGLEDDTVYEVYRSELGGIELLAAGNGRIIALDYGRDTTSKRLISVSLDGLDVRVLEQDASTLRSGCVIDGRFRYVAEAEDFDTAPEPLEFFEHWSIGEIALSGGEPATLIEGFYARDPQIIASGDHLVVYDAGHQMPNIGSNIGALSADGKALVSYAGQSQEYLRSLLPRQ